MSQGSKAKVLVISEDSSKQALPTVQELLRHLLLLAMPEADHERLVIEPLEDSTARNVVFGNAWKSAKGVATAGVVRLVQRLARQLMQGGFVVHHVDGDTVWAERASSENLRAYDDVILRRVRAQLVATRRAGQKKLAPHEADLLMKERLIVLVPHWSIEAWLFQNTEKARALCPDEQHECRERLDRWAGDRGALDEERTPKKLLCFEDRHNLALARDGFPSEDVRAAGKSWAAAADRLAASEALKACLTPSV